MVLLLDLTFGYLSMKEPSEFSSPFYKDITGLYTIIIQTYMSKYSVSSAWRISQGKGYLSFKEKGKPLLLLAFILGVLFSRNHWHITNTLFVTPAPILYSTWLTAGLSLTYFTFTIWGIERFMWPYIYTVEKDAAIF